MMRDVMAQKTFEMALTRKSVCMYSAHSSEQTSIRQWISGREKIIRPRCSLNSLPQEYGAFFIAAWVFGIMYCATAIPVQFIYRYYGIVRQKVPTIQQYTLFFGTAAFSAFSYAVTVVIVFWPYLIVFLLPQSYQMLIHIIFEESRIILPQLIFFIGL